MASLPRSGWHTHRFSNGTYTGAWRGGKRNGQGKFTWASGDIYEGEYRDDRKHGQGTFTSRRGWSYTGALVLDRPTQGMRTEPDGRRFNVTYVSDCAEMRDGPAPKTKKPIVAAIPGGGPRPHGETPGAARRACETAARCPL